MVEYKNLDEFYPYYLSQHSNRINRRLHFIGFCLAILQILRTIFFSFTLGNILLIPACMFSLGYIGHFCFEKNSPVAKYPWLSLQSDVRFFKEIATGQMAF